MANLDPFFDRPQECVDYHLRRYYLSNGYPIPCDDPVWVLNWCASAVPASGGFPRSETGFCKQFEKEVRKHLPMPIGRGPEIEILDGPPRFMLQTQVGLPPSPVAMPLMPPIAGSTEFTAPVGPPSSTPRAIVQRTPPNSNTPSDGIPGGTFNYNALLDSKFKWDQVGISFAANPGVGNEITALLITKPGIYAVEAIISADVAFPLTVRQMRAGVDSDIVATFIDPNPSTFQEILIWPSILPFPNLSTLRLVSGSAAAATIASTLRVKMLASI